MQNPFNAPCDPSMLVDKMIGTAYPTVRFVAQNIEYIKHISFYMPQLFDIYNGLDDLLDLNTNTAALLAARDTIVADIPIIQGYMTAAQQAAATAVGLVGLAQNALQNNNVAIDAAMTNWYNSLPPTDPGVPGKWYKNGGALSVSQA